LRRKRCSAAVMNLQRLPHQRRPPQRLPHQRHRPQHQPLITGAATPAWAPHVCTCRKPLAISSQTSAAIAGAAAPFQHPATTAALVPPASSCEKRTAMTSQASAATARAAVTPLESNLTRLPPPPRRRCARTWWGKTPATGIDAGSSHARSRSQLAIRRPFGFYRDCPQWRPSHSAARDRGPPWPPEVLAPSEIGSSLRTYR